MTLSWLPEPKPRRIEAYRNIYTAKIQQNLFDDLLEDPNNQDDLGILRGWENNTSQIDHTEEKKARIFRYGDTNNTLGVFEKINWRHTRFGEGRLYGVWYGALEERTSILEALYWSYKFAKADLETTTDPIIVERRMFQAECKHKKTIDLRKSKDVQSQLIHRTDYSLCQKLGNIAFEKKIGFYLTYSARNAGGTCVPVFAPEAISNERTLYYFKFTLYKNQDPLITIEQDEIISGFLT